MPELRVLLAKKQWVPVAVDDFEFSVAYHTASMSLMRQVEMQEKAFRLQNANAENTSARQLVREAGEVFCEMVCDWDLVLDGQPLPLTVETIVEVLPPELFNAAMNAIGSVGSMDNSEKKELNPNSGAPLQPTINLAPYPNGTVLSEHPGTWAR